MLKISVVIPTYNRKNFLIEAIESALCQNYPNFEVIVSDNASTDGTEDAIQKYRNRENFLYSKNTSNIGMVENWKKAILQLASGSWFLVLSDDDYLVDPDFLSKAAVLIDHNPDLTLVYSGGYLLNDFSGDKEILSLPFSGIVDGKTVFCSRGMVFPRDFTLCSVIFNRELTRDLDVFSNPYNLCCDSKLFLLSCLYGRVGIVPGYPSVYRFHPYNLSLAMLTDPLLLFGDLDMFLIPYQKAIALGFCVEAELFRVHSNLDGVVRERMLQVANCNGRYFSQFKKELVQKYPEIMTKLLSGFGYNVTVFFYSIRSFFRRYLKERL